MRFDLLTVINGVGKREFHLAVFDIADGQQVASYVITTKRELSKIINRHLRCYVKGGM